MRLADLDPKWFQVDGQRAGVTFLCPHCRKTRVGAKSVSMPMREQMRVFANDFPNNDGEIVPMKQDFAWTITGDNWENLTVSPSIDASASGHWHGHVTNGKIVGGI